MHHHGNLLQKCLAIHFWDFLSVFSPYCSTTYRKQGKICRAKLSHFSRFFGVLRKLFREYKCISLIILKIIMSTYGQGNVKIFPQKLRWHWNCEYLAQQIFPRLQNQMLFASQYTHTVYAKKNTAINCTALSMLYHFDVHKCNTTSYFIIKQVVKLHGFTWRQYWCTASIICGIYKTTCAYIAYNVCKHFLSLSNTKQSHYTKIFHWIVKSTNYM